MSIGEKIKERRIALNLSQRDLAERMGYSNHSTIARIEAGKVDLPQSKIVQFSEVLHISIADLMGWKEEIENDPVGTANRMVDSLIKMGIELKEDEIDLSDMGFMKMIDEYKQLDENKQEQVREYVHFLFERS